MYKRQVRARQAQAVTRLLAAGANPGVVRDGYDRQSALEAAVQAGDAAILRELLAAMPADTLRAALRDPQRSPIARLLREPGPQGAAMLRLFIDAGFDVKTLGAGAIRQALENRDSALALMLIDAGVPVNPPSPLPVDPSTRDGDRVDDRAATPPLLICLLYTSPSPRD